VTPRSETSTPRAVRDAWRFYSTWDYHESRDLADDVRVADYGDVVEPDGDGSDWTALSNPHPFWLLYGGDNALTWRALRELAGEHLADWALVTLDAHHDLRDGRSNGSPVRQLLEAGLPGENVVQVGVADFSNSAFYARRAPEAGITVVPRHVIAERGIEEVLSEALERVATHAGWIYVDVDVDVVDRALVPGCPAAAPGGITVDELRRGVRLLAAHPSVAAMDFTEVDVERDAPDARTVRAVALLTLEALAGFRRRSS
jgi:formiminoglutamase